MKAFEFCTSLIYLESEVSKNNSQESRTNTDK